MFWLAVVPVLVGFVWLSTPRVARVLAPPPPRRLDSLSPSQLQDHTAKNGIVGGATAGKKALASLPNHTPPEIPDFSRTEPVSTPVGGPPTVVTRPIALDRPGLPGTGRTVIRVTGIRSDAPHSSEDRAIADAVEVARLKLIEEFAKLDPPILEVPESWVIRDQYIRPGSVEKILPPQQIKDEWKAAHLNPERVWVKLDIEVSEDQIRHLRAEQRLLQTGTVGGAILILAGVLYGFLRLDAFTKGYLTGGLGAIAVFGAVLVFVGVLFFL